SLVRGDAPGSFKLTAQISARPGTAGAATLAIDLDAVRMEPMLLSGRLALGAFDFATVLPYLKDGPPAVPTKGRLALDLTAALEEGESDMVRAVVGGTVRVTEAAVTQKGMTTPFLTVPAVAVRIGQADALAATLTVSGVEVEGARLRVVR